VITRALLLAVATFCAYGAALLAESPASAAPVQRASNASRKPRHPAPRPIPKAQRAEDSTQAFIGRTVGKVDVQGLKRIEKDAVLNKLALKPGQKLTREGLRADIQSIFAMGFFDDIDVRGESGGSELVDLAFVVRERPVVAKITFEGNERIGTDDLKNVTKIKEWSILDVNKVKEDTALIQKHYEDKGFYLARVTFDVRQVKEDQIELVYKINDYEKVEIKKITFLNNRVFSDDKLRAVFQETKEGGPFSFMSNSGNFKESSFKQDLQRLTYWYLDNGYVKFRYENPVVTVSDDKKYLFITIYVDEGERYSMGDVDFGGELLFSKEELKQDITLGTRDVFSISKRNADIQKLTEKYQDLGYAFTNVIPKMNVKDDSKTVDIEYDFEKGNLVHFGEINVLGNSKTYDKVIRRELKIQEGELYSGTRLRESRENVERLGYFAPGEVLFNTVSPKGKADVLNVEITVKERSTGTITLGAGYGSVQGFFFTTQVSEINLLGRGQTVSLSGQYATDKISKSFNLGFTEPYTFDSRWSTGFDLFFVNFPIPGKYTTRKLGFDVRLGYPIFEYANAFVTYKNEGLQIIDPDDPDGVLKNDIAADDGVLSSTVFSVVRDKRNNRFETTGGNYQSVSLETAGLGGEKKFVKWSLNNRFYTRVVGDLVFRNSLEYGMLHPLAGEPLPPSEKYYLGGPNNLRGYELFSVGPSRCRNTVHSGVVREPLGGAVQMIGLFELEYPLIREAGLKTVVFYDAGNIFDSFPTGNEFKIRTDWGLGFRWFSPIGPLRFEWGFPFRRRDNESSSVFQFFIGTPF
jgi:outer membrane protein insertion porin family